MEWEQLTKVRHKKSGVVYGFLLITNENCENENFVPTAVYRSREEVNYSRPLSEFKEKFELVELCCKTLASSENVAEGVYCKVTTGEYRHKPSAFFGDKIEMSVALKPILTNARVVLDFINDNINEIAPRRTDHCNRSDLKLSVKHVRNMIFGYYRSAIPMVRLIESRLAEIVLDEMRKPETQLINKQRVITAEDVLLCFVSTMVSKFTYLQQMGADYIFSNNKEDGMSVIYLGGMLGNKAEGNI